VRDVQVTLQDVHHPRGHENGQRLAGYVAKPDMCRASFCDGFHLMYVYRVNQDLPRFTDSKLQLGPRSAMP
jgi:hypothetical protein